MKKFKSFLAILLLGGLVATGCGSKDKTPSDSGGSQQNINSGSGDNGGSSQGGGSQQGGEGGGQQGGGGGQTVTTSWPSTTVQVYLDTLGVEHDRVPSIENDAITNYIVSPDITTAQTEKGFSVVCMGGGSLINSYIDTLVANGYSYDISSNAYKTPLGEILIALDSAEGNLVIIIALPDAGGGGGGGATIPDNSRFLNTKITTQTVSTANPQNAQVEAAYANSYIAFFSDGTCELVATYNGIINALFGTYGVNQADNLATIHVYKMYDGEDQFYSWSVDTDLETLSVHYIQSDDNFVLSFSMNYPYTTVNLTLGNPTSDPVRATLPTDPNGTGTTFNNQYQVEIDEWDSWFKEDTPNLQRNFTVTATVPDAFGTGTDTYTIEVDGRRIHKTVDGDPTAEEYYFIDETWYDNSIFEGYYVNTYYKSGNDWVENTHQGIVYDALYSYKCGLHSVNFMDVLYNENQHQYYSSRATYFDSHGYSDELNRYTVKFENTLTKCVLKQVYYQKTYQGLEYTYDFTKVGSTSVSLPNSGGGGDPTPAEWPTSTVQAYLAKIGATQDTLPAASSPNITGYSFYPGNIESVTTYFFLTCDDGASYVSVYAGLLTSNGFTFNNEQETYTSAHNEFMVMLDVYSTQLDINVYQLSGGGGGGGQGGGGEGGQGGGEGGGQQGGGGNIPFNDTVTWESVIGDPPGPEITPEQAETVVNGILTYQASAKVKNARVEEYENGSVINRVEFDTDTLAAYSWSADDNEESFTFVESSTGYYYFTDPDLDNMHPEIQDWYCTYSNIDEYDYDWENEATDFNSRFKGLMTGAYGYANAEIDIDTSVDYSGYGTVTYYSSGAGHIRVVAEIMGYTIVTEWKDYKPLLYGSPDSFTYYSYDVSVKKPESRENYTLYGAI